MSKYKNLFALHYLIHTKLINFYCMNSDSHRKILAFPDQSTPIAATHKRSKPLKRKAKPLENIRQSQQTPYWQHTIADISPADYERELKRSSLLKQQNNLARSLTQVKKKEKEGKPLELFSDQNIFKLPSAQLLANKINKTDIRLPTLDKRRLLEEEGDSHNPQKRKVVKIPIDKLKPLPADEVKRRFMLKYQLQGIKA